MRTNAVEREKVGLLLAAGYTKKEVATKLNKSFHTVNMQSRRLFEISGSRNVADLTRFMVGRYSGIPVEDIIINALHDLTLMVAGALLFYALSQPSTQTEVLGAFDSILSAIRDQIHGWFAKPSGTF